MFEVLPEFDLVPSGWPSVEAEPSLVAVSNSDYEDPRDCAKVVKPDFLAEYWARWRGSFSSMVDSLG